MTILFIRRMASIERGRSIKGEMACLDNLVFREINSLISNPSISYTCLSSKVLCGQESLPADIEQEW